MFQLGTILDGTYQIMEKIGQGGAGMIYKAYHLRLRKYVVIKRIREGCKEQVNVRSEADILKQLHHSYLPQIYDFMQYGTDVYTVMEYIQGYDLEFYMKQGYVFGEEQLLFWLRQLAEVLDYLHNRKPAIIHSDIKPANIMITAEGNVCLIDFNIALNGEEELIGFSPYYSSPEQYMAAMSRLSGHGNGGYVVDARSDIYSLGATYYYLMTGCLPGIGGENAPLETFGLPFSEGFHNIINRMMQPEKEKRYASASKLLYAIEHVKEQKKNYQKALQIRRIAAGVYGILAVIFILFIFKGSGQMRQEHFLRDYEEVRLAYGQGRYEEARDIGLDLLNNDSYRGLWRKHSREKGNVWYVLGIISYEEGNYTSAAGYFADALDCDEDNVEYYQNYAIALAAMGEIDEAEAALDEAYLQGATDGDTAYIAGQIAWKQGEFELAYEKFAQAGIAVSEENRQKLRQLGKFYYEYAGRLGEQQRSLMLSQSKSIFSALAGMRYAGFQDYYHLALACEANGDYEEGVRTLLELEQLYEVDYRVYAHLAIMTYEVEVARQSAYDFSMVQDYCEKAKEMAAGREGVSDSCMGTVEVLLERIK